MSVADLTDDAEGGVHVDVGMLGADMGRLDGGAVGDRIGEGHPELEGVRTRDDKLLDDGEGGFGVGIAEHHERDECAFAELLQFLEKCWVAGHVTAPSGRTRGVRQGWRGRGRFPYRRGRIGRR